MARKYDCGLQDSQIVRQEEDPAMELSRRAVVGILMMIIAIFAASALVRASDDNSLYYVAQKQIAPGDRIASDDLALARLNLPGDQGLYFGSGENLIGMIATEAISTGEAIARSELTDRSDNILWRLVSLDLARNDIPISVMSGSLVDLYRLEDRNMTTSSRAEMTELVLSSLVVDEIVPGGSLSDRTQIILRVRLPEVRILLDAYSRGPLLVVDHV